MKIALVHYAAPPTIGGVERVMGQQAQVLRAFGHEVKLVVSQGEAAPFTTVLPQFGSDEALRAELADQDWVIVHNLFTMPFDWDASERLARMSQEPEGPRWVNWVHDVDVSPEQFHALKLKAKHVTVSAQRREKFLSLVEAGETCQVIPNGLDMAEGLGLTPRVERVIEELSLLDQDLVIFHPTRVVARKNLELGLRVTRTLLDQGLKVKYVVTGAPDPHRASSREYAQKIQALRNELKLESAVHFLGETQEVEDADIQGLYRIADLLFFPSFSEGFGLPLLEGVMHRVPVLCSDLPIHREVGGDLVSYFGLETALDVVAAQVLAALPAGEFSRKRRQMIRDFTWKHIYNASFAPLIEIAPGTSH